MGLMRSSLFRGVRGGGVLFLENKSCLVALIFFYFQVAVGLRCYVTYPPHIQSLCRGVLCDVGVRVSGDLGWGFFSPPGHWSRAFLVEGVCFDINFVPFILLAFLLCRIA